MTPPRPVDAIAIRQAPFRSADYGALLDLRWQALRAPLGLAFTPEELAADAASTHVGAFDGQAAVGSLILTPQGAAAVRLRQMAVEEAYRGQGLGSRLMVFAEEIMRRSGRKVVVCHARLTAVGFYAGHGFEAQGAGFVERTLPHVRMERRLAP